MSCACRAVIGGAPAGAESSPLADLVTAGGQSHISNDRQCNASRGVGPGRGEAPYYVHGKQDMVNVGGGVEVSIAL